MNKLEKHGWGRFPLRTRSVQLSVVLLLTMVGVVTLLNAPFRTGNRAEGQVIQRRLPFGRPPLPLRGRNPGASELPAEIDGSREIPFELLYSRSGSIYRNFRYAIENNNTERAILLAQAILNSHEDHFVSEETGPAYSLKKLALDYIESLSKEALKDYQDRWSLDAEVQLEAARKSQDPADYLELLDSYYFTESGFEAVDWLATRALDLGRFRSASRLWNDVIDSPVHVRRVTPILLIKAAVANRLAGHGERAAELMQRLSSTDEGRRLNTKLENYLKLQARQQPAPINVPTGSAPDPWAVSLVDSLSDAERDLLNTWRQAQWGEDRAPLCISREAVTAGDLLAVRSFNGVLFLDSKSGKVQSEYPVKPRLIDVAEEFEQSRLGGQSWERISSRSDFLEKFVWNTLHSQLTTDDRHVYLIEEDDSWSNQKPLRPGERIMARAGDQYRRDNQDPIPMNRIVALPVEQTGSGSRETVLPVWTISPVDNQPEGTSGAYFLAAPINVDGALYTLAEQDDSIKLMCLDPVTGRLLWSQGVTLPFSLLYEDPDRRWRGCAIKDAGDLLVVTTQVGVVVAINPVRRVLEWVYYIGDPNGNRRFALVQGQLGNTSFNYLGFLDEPLIADGRVLLLPRQSSFLHCLDLDSGQVEWKVPRFKAVNSAESGEGDEYLGGVYEHVLVVVGTRNTRGVSMHDGSELWRVAHPQISGRGVMQNGQYLLPLFQGSFWRIDVATGQIQKLNLGGDATAASDLSNLAGISGDHSLEQQQAPLPRYGHLMIHGPQLISLGIETVRSLNEPSAWYESLRSRSAQQRLSVEEQLDYVMLDPASTVQERVAFLEEILQQDSIGPESRRRLLGFYQNELFLQLEQHPEELITISNKLEELLKSDEDRVRLTILRSQQQMAQRDAQGVLASLSQLIQYDTDHLFAVPGDESLSVSVGSWVRVLWDWTGAPAPAEFRSQRDAVLDSLLQAALASGDAESLDRLLRQFPQLSQLDEARLRLAQLRKAESNYHAAEMLLLTLTEREEDTPRRAEAMVELADLWATYELFDRAATLLQRPAFQRRAGELSESAQTLLTNLGDQRGMRKAFSNLELPSNPLPQVVVESHKPGYRQRLISDAYDRYFRIFPTTRECEFDLLAKRHPTDTKQHVLAIVSRQRGSVAAEINIPSRGSGLNLTNSCVVGHYYPFASEGQIRGISLIDTADGRPSWTRSFLDPDMHVLLSVGSFDSEQTSFRTNDSIVVVNSRDGRVLWRRDHLEPSDGSNGNTRLPPLYGDERVTVRRVRDSDLEFYNTITGFSLPQENRIPTTGVEGTVGRFVVAIKYDDQNQSATDVPSVVIYDAETGREVYSSAYWTRHCCDLAGNHLVLIDRQRMLRVIDVAQQREVLAIPLSQEETDSVSQLEYFTDAYNHYVNIRRSTDPQRLANPDQLANPVRMRGYAAYASNPFLPTIDVMGQLIAIDKQSRTRRWDRDLQMSSVLQFPNAALPFLTTLSWRVEQRVPNIRRLRLEVFSPETGETLGYTDDFVPLDQHQQLYHTRYDREAGLLELNGPMYRATIRFNLPIEKALLDPGPL